MVNRSMTTGGPVPRGDVRAQMRQIAGVPALADAPAALLSELASFGHVVHIRPQWAMIAEQTAADKAYVLLDGEVDVRRHGVEVNHCTAGDFLGEVGIVQRRLRSATVVTASDVTALHLDRAAFEHLYAGHRYFRAVVDAAMERKTA
ncbi:MAG TPA: cyclic nucleotide-binding domain-containing protein [Marmoricola sp.]|nr:cyclic nucleotide-binding domain-containing protein [Marmoricola sp.]